LNIELNITVREAIEIARETEKENFETYLQAE